MNWSSLNQSEAKSIRGKIYKFLLSKPMAVRELLRKLTVSEAEALLDLLCTLDNRRKIEEHEDAKSDRERELDQLFR